MVTAPVNNPEDGAVSVRVKDWCGCNAVTFPVLSRRASLSEAASTCTVPAPARFGSLTVTVTASLHSYRMVRSTDRVAHCLPACTLVWQLSPAVVHCAFEVHAAPLSLHVFRIWQPSPGVVHCAFEVHAAPVSLHLFRNRLQAGVCGGTN